VLASAVALLEDTADVALGLLLLGRLGDVNLTLQLGAEVEAEAGGEDVGLVVDLEEGPDAGAVADQLLRHTLVHLSWVAVNTGKQAATERSVLILVGGADHDSLAASETALKHNNNLTGLEKLTHSHKKLR